MRGVGVGILFTSMILLFTDKSEELTDAEIKLRAAALGMVEETILPEEKEAKPEAIENTKVEKELSNEGTEVENTENLEEVVQKQEEIEEETEEETEINQEDPELAEAEEKEEIAEEEQEERYVSVIIESGDVARTVSTKLFEAGLIESIEDYSNFLSGNSYSYRLRAGEHKIPVGADNKTIAEIICKIAGE